MFTKETYINRRARLKKDVGSGILLFLGNDDCPMNYAANAYHFRQDSTFLYFFGSNYAGLDAIIDIDADKEIIFGNELTVEDIVWMGPQPTIKEKSERVGIQHTQPVNDLANYLKAAMAKGQKLHYLPPYRPEHQVKLFNLLNIPFANQALSASVDFIKAIINQRNYKSAEEVEELHKAVLITEEMHLTAMRMARPGMKELDIAAAVTEVALRHGGNLSFPVIATIRGETLHNHYYGNTLKEGDMFLLDTGAETANRYCGDLSSTIPVSKKFTDRQKTIYEIVLDSHLQAVAALKPGKPFRDVYYLACKVIGEGMKSLGLMKGDMEEAVSVGATALFFPCGLGHMLGMDTHDMENLGEVWVGYNGEPKSTRFGLKSLRLARPLEPGFVFTVEPGIYMNPELIDMWKAEKRFEQFINYNEVEKYKGFGGTRVEECFVITETGYRRLGNALPKKVADIEAIR